MYVPISRHLYGELSRTQKGCSLLTDRGIVEKLLAVVRNDSNQENTRRSAFWALGHIGSTDPGFALISSHDSKFLDWCVSFIPTAKNFSLRGTAFYTIGLLSRSKKGFLKLAQLGWISSPLGSNTAISIPQNPAILFETTTALDANDGHISPAPPESSISTKHLSGFSGVESEILHLILKVKISLTLFASFYIRSIRN
jgi:hypothetical protein